MSRGTGCGTGCGTASGTGCGTEYGATRCNAHAVTDGPVVAAEQQDHTVASSVAEDPEKSSLAVLVRFEAKGRCPV